MDQYPCDHGMYACRECKITPYSMSLHYYGADAYRASYVELIYTVRYQKQWHALEDVFSHIVLPPTNAHRLAGRQKKLRVPSQWEEIIVCRCSRCHGIGHNRARCKNQFFYVLGETSNLNSDGDASCH